MAISEGGDPNRKLQFGSAKGAASEAKLAFLGFGSLDALLRKFFELSVPKTPTRDETETNGGGIRQGHLAVITHENGGRRQC